MARGRKRIRREQQTAGRPSLFFIIALTLGILVLLFVFIQTLRHPTKQEPLVPKRGAAAFRLPSAG